MKTADEAKFAVYGFRSIWAVQHLVRRVGEDLTAVNPKSSEPRAPPRRLIRGPPRDCGRGIPHAPEKLRGLDSEAPSPRFASSALRRYPLGGTSAIVSEGRWTIVPMDIVAPLLAVVATFLQTYTSMKELGRARRSEVEWWITEDELVDEIPAWKPIEKRRGRRTLVSMRPEDVDKEIRHMNRVLLGWVLLDGAAAFALVDAIMN